MTMKLIGTANASGSSVSFTNIPQDGTDLMLVISQRLVDASSRSESEIRINGFGTGYESRRLETNGTTASSGTNASRVYFSAQGGSGTTSSTFGNVSAYIPNYSKTQAKSILVDSVSENNATLAYVSFVSATLSGTAPISSLTYRDYNAAELDGGTLVSLYMITNGSGGATVSTT